MPISRQHHSWFNSRLCSRIHILLLKRMKTIYSGLESSGKSLRLAKVVCDLVYRNHKWKEKSGVTRKIVSNLKFTDDFYEWATVEMGIPITYWTDLEELIQYDNVDIIIDEVGTYFDSRLWSDLSLDVRRWLTQGAKTGIEIYGSAQDFAQVDLAFRRLVNHLYHITKLLGSGRPSPTKPPIRRIWGLCSMRELNPREYKEDKKSFDTTQLFPSFFLIERRYCEIFDTTQKIQRSKPAPLKHIERDCEQETCSFHKLIHV